MGTGKKDDVTGKIMPGRKHPRGDGEEIARMSTLSTQSETPPWGRGRKAVTGGFDGFNGNTPVGTGKNRFQRRKAVKHLKHPRGDGEEQEKSQ